MRFPLEKIARHERVGAKLEDTAEGARGRSGPEGKLLHEIGAAASEEGREILMQCGVEGGGQNFVQCVVVSGVFQLSSVRGSRKRGTGGGGRARTAIILPDMHERIPIPNLRLPAPHKMTLHLLIPRNLRVDLPNQADILIVCIGLDTMELDRVDIFPARQDLGIRLLHLRLLLLPLLATIQDGLNDAGLGPAGGGKGRSVRFAPFLDALVEGLVGFDGVGDVTEGGEAGKMGSGGEGAGVWDDGCEESTARGVHHRGDVSLAGSCYC